MRRRTFWSRAPNGSSSSSTRGLQHEGPRQRHALLLTAAQLADSARLVALELDDLERLAHALTALAGRTLCISMPKAMFWPTVICGNRA